MANQAEKLQQLRDALAQLLALALACPRGGGSGWDAELERLGLRGLPKEDREQHLREGAPLVRGPLPLELRWALERVGQDYEGRIGDGPRADTLVAETLRQFIKGAKPAPSTSSIFATALATTKTYASTSAGTGTLACTSCGAPRMAGDTRLLCMYCGSEAFS